jgi:hypothetical protein
MAARERKQHCRGQPPPAQHRFHCQAFTQVIAALRPHAGRPATPAAAPPIAG